MQFVFERKQIALMADEKSPTRISHRLLAINRSEMRSNMAKKYNRDLILNGSMLSAILSLAIPVVINSFLQTMYNLTDTYWLGHIGKEELAAINLVTPVILSIVMAVAVFMIAPYYVSRLFALFVKNDTAVIIIEGIVRLVFFIVYVKLISLMNDIKRVYMYHGAEHKCINCIEHGMELTVENVLKSSKEHKRCGTSFLLIVMCISIVFFMFIRVESPVLRLVLRILLVPVIAGVSYEVLRLAGNSDSKFMDIVSRPGLWLQHLTTREPDASMVEVAIASVEAVFDWRTYVEKLKKEEA